MLDQWLRETKDAVFRPFIRGPLRTTPPDRVTRAAFAAGLACGLCAAGGFYRAALVLWGINRVLDGLDGTMARVQKSQNDWGGYQDILLDHLVYALVPLGIAFSQARPSVMAACAVLQASYFVNTISWCYLSALLEKRQAGATSRGESTSITMPSALIEGTETVMFFSLFLLCPAWAGPLFSLKAGLVLVGVRQRWHFASQVLPEAKKEVE
jgi:phosphatidylglycerophosphate synthase